MRKIVPVFCLLFLVLLTLSCKKDPTIEYVGTPPPDTLALTSDEKALILAGDDTTLMRVLTINILDDSLKLRTKSHDVRPDTNDAALMQLIHRMLVTVKDPANPGVGIAAPQVGINRNIIWVQRLDKAGKPFEVYLNPRIVLYSNKQIIFNGDGCLSIPGVHGNSHRSSAVVVEYDLPDGSHHQELIEGYSSTNFTSVIFQHEIDHLNGILFIDRL
ncbi:MAG: peptide deformylase [Bacteroidota bacterium]